MTFQTRSKRLVSNRNIPGQPLFPRAVVDGITGPSLEVSAASRTGLFLYHRNRAVLASDVDGNLSCGSSVATVAI
jgi:hypothetical protein